MIEIQASLVIPQKMQDALMALADAGDTQEWGIGDQCNDFFDLYWYDVKAKYPKAKIGDVYNMIAGFCGRKPDTVRMYHRVSKGVSKAMRDEFDMLSRHHHKAILATSQGEAGEHRRLCLWWLAQADEFGGKIGPVHALEAALRAEADPNPDPAWKTRLKRILAQLDKLSEDQEAPQIVRDNAGAAIVALESDWVGEDPIRIAKDDYGATSIGGQRPEDIVIGVRDYGAFVRGRENPDGTFVVEDVKIFKPAQPHFEEGPSE